MSALTVITLKLQESSFIYRYASTFQYQTVSKALVTKYPNLQDKGLFCRTGYVSCLLYSELYWRFIYEHLYESKIFFLYFQDTWWTSLRNKCKKGRRKGPETEQTQIRKAKYGHNKGNKRVISPLKRVDVLPVNVSNITCFKVER